MGARSLSLYTPCLEHWLYREVCDLGPGGSSKSRHFETLDAAQLCVGLSPLACFYLCFAQPCV